MEAIARLKFLTPCLGNERHADRDLMLRDSNGSIIFMPSWWRSVFKFAVQARSKFFNEVDKIKVDPVITGNTTVYKRYYSKTAFKEHEAFDAGAEIEAHFWLPNNLGPEDLKDLLVLAGKYVGLSPYGHEQDYGRFQVIDVVTRKTLNCSSNPPTASGEPVVSNTGP